LDLDAYLHRIRYDGPRDASAATLAAVAHRHAMAIPFENLSVLASGPPDLELGAIEDKLVQRRRGGYCYEQNHLLLGALRALGFDVEPLSARVRYALPAGTPTPRSHMVLRVTTGAGSWLVDAGFGRFTLTAPVNLATRDPQQTSHEPVRVVPIEDGFVLQFYAEREWRDAYSFDFVPQLPVDYVQQNFYTAARPGALFATNLVVTMPGAGGRRTLFNRTLAWRSSAGAAERTSLESIDALRDVLQTAFGLRIDGAELARAWEVSGRGNDALAMFV
jgi:N-hydroxyarylamine O-acetyltransferase